MFPSKETFLIN